MKLMYVVATIAFVSMLFSGSIVIAEQEIDTGCSVDDIDNDHVHSLNESEDSIKYHISIDEKSDCARVSIEHDGNEKRPVTARIDLDGYTLDRHFFEIDPNDMWSKSWDLSNQYDATQSEHEVLISTSASALETTIDEDFDLDDPDIPAQRITDVELVEAVDDDGDRVAQANVTFENPSPHAHPGEMFVHTEETHGVGTLAQVPIGEEEETRYVLLEDDPDDPIEGEIRYNSEGIDQDEGIRDQVWFRGEIDGDTTFQREEFEPVSYPDEQNSYRYGGDDTEDADGTAVRYLLGALAIAGGLGLVILKRYRL